MNVKIKKLNPEAVIPSYAKPGDAGMDLTAVSRKLVTEDNTTADYIEYGTGLAIEIPEGFVGLLFPRSSNTKKNLTLGNSVGIIDSGYRGEITFRYKLDKDYDKTYLQDNNPIAVCSNKQSDYYEQKIYDIGDRIGQIIIIPFPEVEFEEVEELSETERGTGGYGSTDKK